MHGPYSLSHAVSGYPRWVLPSAGVVPLVALYLLWLFGSLAAAIAFPAMAVLTLVALVIGQALPDHAEEDRRADLPIGMALTYALLYVLKTGLFWDAIMAGSWVALIFGGGYAIMHDVKWRWVALALAGVLLLNLMLFFGQYRP